MKKNHFIFSYAGNKRKEVEKIQNYLKEKINFDKIKKIVEPFCGSSSYSYYLSCLYPKKFKYILNDNNQLLIEIYNILKNDNLTNKLINEMNELMVGMNKEKYDKFIKDNKENYKGYLLMNYIFNIHPGLYKSSGKFKSFDNIRNYPIIKFLRNEDIEFYNIDGIEIFEKYKNDKSSIIFLDPPYLDCFNDFYKNPNLNIYEYFSNNDIGKMKSYIFLVLEKNWIISLLFKNNNKFEYDKIYQTTKKHTTHIIITNK